MNDRSIKHVDTISAKKGDLKKLEVNTIVAKERCVAPDSIYSKQAAHKSYVDTAISNLVKPKGQKVTNAVTAWDNNGKLISTEIIMDGLKNISNIDNINCSTLRSDNIVGKVAQLSEIFINGGEIKLSNGAGVSGVQIPLRDDNPANKLYVDSTFNKVEAKHHQKDAYVNYQEVSTVTTNEDFLPFKRPLAVAGDYIMSKVNEDSQQIHIITNAFYRIIVTGNCIASSAGRVPNAKAFLLLNNTTLIASKPFGNRKLSFDLIAHEQLNEGSLIGLKAKVLASTTEKLLLKFTITVEVFSV